MSTKIAPSILSCDFGRLAQEVATVSKAGAEWIHVDVMDGRFVPPITVGPLVTAAVRRATDRIVDVHLMIEDPDRHLEGFVSAGADVVTVHQEASVHLHRTLDAIRKLGAKAGVAINPGTPVESLVDVLTEIDLLLIMSVNPGYGGQSFIEASVAKVARARAMLNAAGRQGVEIQVDGGVDASTAPGLVRAGATVLVAGSAVYGYTGGPTAGVEAIRAVIQPPVQKA